MISNLVAYAVARAFSQTPIYEALASQDGVHLPRARGHREEAELLVGAAMRRSAVLLPPELGLLEARERVPEGDILVGQGARLLGFARAGDIESALLEATDVTLGSVMQSATGRIPHVHPDHPADIVLHRLAQYDVTVLPVLDRRDITRALGEITLRDVTAAYREHHKG
jgi:CBS domain-containing protein